MTCWPKLGGGKRDPKIAPWPLACSHVPARAGIRNRNISGGGGWSGRRWEGFHCPFQGGQLSRRKLGPLLVLRARPKTSGSQDLQSRLLILGLRAAWGTPSEQTLSCHI